MSKALRVRHSERVGKGVRGGGEERTSESGNECEGESERAQTTRERETATIRGEGKQPVTETTREKRPTE